MATRPVSVSDKRRVVRNLVEPARRYWPRSLLSLPFGLSSFCRLSNRLLRACYPCFAGYSVEATLRTTTNGPSSSTCSSGPSSNAPEANARSAWPSKRHAPKDFPGAESEPSSAPLLKPPSSATVRSPNWPEIGHRRPEQLRAQADACATTRYTSQPVARWTPRRSATRPIEPRLRNPTLRTCVDQVRGSGDRRWTRVIPQPSQDYGSLAVNDGERVVRYTIDGRHRSKSFRTRIEADRYRGRLLQAVQDGGRFDETSGEPESWQTPLADLHVHEWARRWLAEPWSEWQLRTRASAVEALARFTTIAIRGGATPTGGVARLPLHRTRARL